MPMDRGDEPDLITLAGWLGVVALMSALALLASLASPTILLWWIFIDRFPF